MLGLGVPELLVILVIIIAVFGVGKLSQAGGALGKSVKDFRESSGIGAPPPGTSTTTTKTTIVAPADEDKKIIG